ncbi:MAG: alpha-hydroxy-acid oxidizing protein, partial [Burkholderiaceae bacterium]
MNYHQAVTIADLRQIAKRKLPRSVFGFIDGAAFDEHTLRENESDFARIRFAPRFMVDVAQRSQAVTVLGHTYQSPIILGPTGLAGILWPWGDLHIARACKALGGGFCQSTNSNASIEQEPVEGKKPIPLAHTVQIMKVEFYYVHHEHR